MFNTYDKATKKIVIKSEIPYFCEKYFFDPTKKCVAFYDKVVMKETLCGYHQCPYGFSCIKTKSKIYTGLIINGHSDMSKVYIHLKVYNQMPHSFSIYSKEQINKIVCTYESMEDLLDIYELTVHDIKNATKSMLDLTEQFEESQELNCLLSKYDELYNASIGYGLIKYRLDYHDLIVDQNMRIDQRKGNLNAHKIIKKLTHQLYYRAQKKGIRFIFDGNTSNTLYQYASIYLGFFLLLENAIKYSLENTSIIIHFEDISSEITKVMIQNMCLPILDEELAKLYDKGYRAQSVQTFTKGNGLGLSLTQQIF